MTITLYTIINAARRKFITPDNDYSAFPFRAQFFETKEEARSNSWDDEEIVEFEVTFKMKVN